MTEPPAQQRPESVDDPGSGPLTDPGPDLTSDPTPDLTPDRPLPADDDRQPGAGPTREPGAQTQAGTPGRDRLLEALRRPWSPSQTLVGVLLAALGFAAVAQVQANDETQFVGARQSDLIALINTLSLATDRAQAEITDLRRTRNALADDAEATQTALAVARRRAETLGILAGTVPATGPGLRVTVEAPPGSVGTDQLLNGIQELRNAGAEAMEFNDTARVVAQTAITDEPTGGLEVDGQLLRPPYVLDVIGDPFTLAAALQFEGGFTDDVEQVGGTVRIQELDEVEVTATRPPQEPEFAEPVEEE